VALILLPVANSLLALMIFIIITNFGMSLFRSPTVSWLGDLFPPEQRSQANGLINLMGGIGGAIALFGSGMLFDAFGRVAPFAAAAAILLLSEAIAVWQVKEPEQIQEEVEQEPKISFFRDMGAVLKSQGRDVTLILVSIFLYFMAYEALQTGLTSFAVFSLGMTPGAATISTALFAAAFILFAVPAGLLSKRLGRKRTMMVGLVGMIVLFSVGYFTIQAALTLGVILVFTGIMWSCVNVNSLPLVLDYGDENKIGVYTGLYYVAAQAAAVAGPVLSAAVVELMGNNYRWLWPVSGVYVLLAWIALNGVKKKVVE
jgi:MFS family permease